MGEFKSQEKRLAKSIHDVVSSIQGLPIDLLFRGQVNNEWPVQPTLLRNEKSPKWQRYESCLFDAWLKYKEDIPYPKSNDPFDYLATLQHFGTPTRLLDVTSDIYTALFFACYDPENKYEDKDGALFMINKVYFQEEQLSQMQIDEHCKIDSMHSRLNFTDIRLITPFEKNPRLRAQHGQFLCFPFGSIAGCEGHYATLNEFSRFVTNEMKTYNQKKHPEKNWNTYNAHCLMYIEIDKNYKKSILQELAIEHGVSEQSLFVPTPKITMYEPLYKYIEWWAMQTAEIISPLIEQISLDNTMSNEQKADMIYKQYVQQQVHSKETFEFDIPIIISSKE